MESRPVNDSVYEYIVIGKGLMGAAAARYLSAISPRVVVIGPDEPLHRASHQGVFGSHYDEGRITRILDPDRIWALLAQRSIVRYRDIEAQSGIPFYHEVGHLMVGPEPHSADDFVARVQHVAAELNVEYTTYTAAALAERFPYLAFEPGSVGMYQPHTAGHVSPRAQVQAQTTVAQKQGAAIITETVEALHQTASAVEVRTDAGKTYRGAKVLVATGGFSNAKPLLPQPLEVAVYARTIVLMELDAAEVARLQGMPSIIYRPREAQGRCYILPPIRYPDGKYYVKIGGHPNDPTLHSLAALQDWFRNPGDAAAGHALATRLRAVVPGLRPVSVHTEPCVTTHTPSEHPYAEKLASGRVGILVGGNGSAAKSAVKSGVWGRSCCSMNTGHTILLHSTSGCVLPGPYKV
jgi:glycine/D-amino acid oxidase-like deaminating enzyme